MPSESTRALLLPLSIVVSVAAGVFIGATFSKTNLPVNPAPSRGTANEELTSALRALTTELSRSRSELGASEHVPVVSNRVEATATAQGDIAHEIREATKQLAGAVDQLRLVSMRVSGDRAPLVPPRSPPDESVVDVFTQDTVWDQSRAYLMWTYQQVLDHFGEPRSVNRADFGVKWVYRPASGKTIFFSFTDGRVCEITCTDPKH